MGKLASVKDNIFGNTDQIGNEGYFISATTFASAPFLILLCNLHLLMELKLTPLILGGSSVLVLLF
ncbi:hypothetical protein [Saccharicrinis sp. 156]|uniref:hypothetical protein n=1 Tax=Saccharicrinis sp. 156 TaxID=3417574 RepID=UPI003D358D8C